MYKILSFDYETTKTIPQVYSWGIYGDNFWKYGISINTFFDTIRELDSNYLLYAHNGSKFDFKFILPQLKSLGFKQKEFKENSKELHKTKVSKFKYDKLAEKYDYDIHPDEYTTLIDGNGKILEIVIGIKSTKRSGKNRVVRLRDSNMMFPNSLKEYGNTLNIHYKTHIYTKTELDSGYTKDSLYNSLNEFEQDGNQLEYLKQDCFILHSFLTLMSQKLSINYWKITAASTAYHTWRTQYFGRTLLEDAIQSGEVKEYKPKKARPTDNFFKYRYKNKTYSSTGIVNVLIQQLFPVKWMDRKVNETFVSQDLYKWYKGGITFINPKYKGIIFNKDLTINFYDIKSSYPSSMVEGQFPFGLPVLKEEKDKEYLRLYEVTTLTECYNTNGLPFVPQLTGKEKLYTKKLPKDFIFYLTDIELIRFKKFYKGKIKTKVKYSFEKISGKKIFGEYIYKFYKDKEEGKREGDKGREILGKLNINALYGKFGSKTEIISTIYNDEQNVYEKDGGINQAKFYLPLAIWITAYSRMKLVDAIDDKYHLTAYGDTDSVAIPTIAINKFTFTIGKELGNWDLEKDNLLGIFRRPKQYLLWKEDNGEKTQWKTGYAGIRYKNDYPPVDDYIYGGIVEDQLRPNLMDTGIQLEDFDKEIKPIWDYTPHPEDWFTNRKEYEEKYDFQLSHIIESLGM